MTKYISSCNILLSDAFYTESDIVSWLCLLHLLVMHLDCLAFTSYSLSFSCWNNNDLVSDLHDTGLDSSYRDCSSTSDAQLTVIDDRSWSRLYSKCDSK